MNNVPFNLIESLKTMGLTEYEAKVYSTLVLFKQAEVKRIYEYLNVPKPSVYQSLKSLMDKGLVMMVTSKPAIYRAVPPKIALKHLMIIHENAEKNALYELERFEDNSGEIEDVNIIWTLFGEKNVEHSMEELIGKAHNSMKLILPTEYLDYLSFINDKNIEIELIMFEENISIAARYGLNNLKVHNGIRIDFSDFGSLNKYLNQITMFREHYFEYIFILIDNNEFMYVPPFPETTKPGIFSMNSYLVLFANVLFNAIWDHTPEISLK